MSEHSLVKAADVEKLAPLLANLPEDMVNGLSLSPDTVALLTAHIDSEGSLGLKSRLPMVCRGSDCPFSGMCVFQQTGMAPVGHGCPEEKMIIDRMLSSLIKQLGVDVDNAIELDMLVEYVDAELQEIRAQKTLAEDGQTQKVVTTVDQATGTPYFETRESASLAIKERAQRRKEKFRKDFLATREQRHKFKLTTEVDESVQQSEKLKIYQKLMERNPEKFKDINFVDITDKE